MTCTKLFKSYLSYKSQCGHVNYPCTHPLDTLDPHGSVLGPIEADDHPP